MRKFDNYFCWSDNWWIEENNAWFVDGERDILFKLDFLTNQCEYIKEIPNNTKWKFRQNPRCLKYKDDIICLPDLSEYIWIYHADEFEKIEIKNPDKVRILINNFWIFDDKLYAVSVGLKQIIEIDIVKHRINNFYSLCGTDGQIAGSIRVREKVFVVSATSNQVYEFDLITKKREVYELANINDKFYTICFDGKKFWLSGYNKAIYCWNKDTNSIKIIEDIPENFGIYDFTGKADKLLDCETKAYDTPIFIAAKFVGKYIWFIPFKTNEILYINIDTQEVAILDTKEENENTYSLMTNRMKHKYLLMYLRKEQYIGVFSLKNNRVFEIDTKNLKINNKKYTFSNRYLNDLKKNTVVFEESNFYENAIFKQILLTDNLRKPNVYFNEVGLKIYQKFVE